LGSVGEPLIEKWHQPINTSITLMVDYEQQQQQQLAYVVLGRIFLISRKIIVELLGSYQENPEKSVVKKEEKIPDSGASKKFAELSI
jgi:hypothetical protein